MQLVSFSCRGITLNISNVDLQAINLLVGRNGGGKSNVLHRIESFAEIIINKEIHPVIREWTAKFKDSNSSELEYCFKWNKPGLIIGSEQLKVNGKLLIDRTQDYCRVFSEQTGKEENFSPPADRLVIHVRRDTKAYPYFEKLIEWAKESHSFRFGSIVSDRKSLDQKLTETNFSPLEPDDSTMSVATIFTRLPPRQQRKIRDLLNELGYNIGSLTVYRSGDTAGVTLTEEEIYRGYDLSIVSQGTLRIFVLLSYVLYLIANKKPQLIIIDDLGEGLDYNRAVKLGKFILDICAKEKIQLIATSNDGFLMDTIPIKYWNILRRNGLEISALNEKNHPQLFEDFAFTGLSNFDFFSSDYIDSHLK